VRGLVWFQAGSMGVLLWTGKQGEQFSTDTLSRNVGNNVQTDAVQHPITQKTSSTTRQRKFSMTLYYGVMHNWMTCATRTIQQKFWACNIQYQLGNLPGYIVERFLWYQEQYTQKGKTKHAVHTSRYSHSCATEHISHPVPCITLITATLT
jgi:hypothetical protein